jgi:hypothetical protein
MSNLVLDEKKIDTLVSSYQDTEKLIYAGSDEHLDLILDLQNSIKKLVKLSIDVNEELEKSFNDLTEEQAKTVVIKLTSGLRNAKQLITVLRNLHPSLSDGIKSCRKELYLETKQIDEFVQDLIKYKINNPQELKDLLNEIK